MRVGQKSLGNLELRRRGEVRDRETVKEEDELFGQGSDVARGLDEAFTAVIVRVDFVSKGFEVCLDPC